MIPPLASLALAFIFGIAVQQASLAPLWALGVVLAGSLGLLWVAWLASWRWGVLALAQAALLGALAAASAAPQAAPGLLTRGSESKPWNVRARVVEAPERALGNVHVLLGLEEVARDGSAHAASGRIWLRLGGEPVEPLLPGDLVVFRALLHEPRGFAEPDSPDPARRLAERDVIAVAGVPDPRHLVRINGAERPSLLRWIACQRSRMLAFVQAHLAGDRRALVESLILGERGDVSRQLDDAFRLSGVTHVLSVSGLHLAIAAFLFYVGLRRLLLCCEPLARRIDVRRIAAVAALPAVLFYTLLTGAQVATVRSCVVAFVWLTGAALARPPNAWAALGLAAIVILGDSPLALYDPSFQLSFAAALGGIVIVPPLVRGRLLGAGLARRLGRTALGIFAASFAATVATAPISAWHFAQVAPAGLLTNLVIVPLAEMWVLPVGLIACALAMISPAVAVPILWLAGLGAGAMAWVAGHAAALPGVEQLRHMPPPRLLEAVLWYLAIGLIALRGRRAWRGALACLLAGALLLGGRLVWPRIDPALTVTFLDVGQGDACLLRLPDGKTMMVDGGGSASSNFDPGAQLIGPWLVREGVTRLDVVVMSHPHPDHANGLASLVEQFAVGEIWAAGEAPQLPAWQRISETAHRRGIPIVKPHELRAGGAQVEVLAPLVGGNVQLPENWSENDASVVLRVSYGGRAVLLTGDIESLAESSLLDGKQPLRADILKAPHHGSRTSSTVPFAEKVAPSLVVFSVGAGNRWGFPAPEVVARYRQGGARTLRTDRDGAVVVRVNGRGQMAVETARSSL